MVSMTIAASYHSLPNAAQPDSGVISLIFFYDFCYLVFIQKIRQLIEIFGRC